MKISGEIGSGDLARIIDAVSGGRVARLEGIVERCVGSATVKEPVITRGIKVPSDDLPRIVNRVSAGAVISAGAARCEWIVERRIAARAIKESVSAGRVSVVADNLARIVIPRATVPKIPSGSSMVTKVLPDFRNPCAVPAPS